MDRCDNVSPDYCDGASASTDVCNNTNPDDYAGGGNENDQCEGGNDQDECTNEGGCVGGDQTNSSEDSDECDFEYFDQCNFGTPDNPAPPE